MVVWEKTERDRDNLQHDRQNVSNYLAPIEVLQLKFFSSLYYLDKIRGSKRGSKYSVSRICRQRSHTPKELVHVYKPYQSLLAHMYALGPKRTCASINTGFSRGVSRTLCMFGIFPPGAAEKTRPEN